MFRISAIVIFSLIFGISAKPYKPWNKLPYGAVQETVVSVDDKGMVSWGVEVEPPEDMDETDYDIDPGMRIWKSMAGNADKAEEDLDELYHPSMADLLKARILDGLRDASAHSDVWEEVTEYEQQPEEDRDDVDHPVFYNVDSEEPERDRGDVYHKAQEEEAGQEVRGQVRVHLQPEEDMDEVYHRDPVNLDRRHTGDAYPVERPSQRKYTEPESDMDDVYHN